MSVTIKNLVKVYGTQRAVSDVSFSAQPGEILGFLGPNGAGKSTTLKIATSYLVPTAGKVSVCGYDVTEKPAEVRQRTGYLPEHNPLYPEMYVREYLGFVAGLYGIRGRAKTQRIAELVELCGLGREQHKPISALSKGYRQRVGLAQALLHDPELLILDEPTSGLDPNQIVEIRKVIREIGAEKTVVFSTHILQEVQALCDRVIIINKGELVADSTVTELNASGDTSRFQVSVGFAEPLEKSLLEALPHVQQVTQQTGGFRVSASADPRRAIFELAVQQGNPILHLQPEKQSLESIFQGLTR